MTIWLAIIASWLSPYPWHIDLLITVVVVGQAILCDPKFHEGLKKGPERGERSQGNTDTAS